MGQSPPPLGGAARIQDPDVAVPRDLRLVRMPVHDGVAVLERSRPAALRARLTGQGCASCRCASPSPRRRGGAVGSPSQPLLSSMFPWTASSGPSARSSARIPASTKSPAWSINSARLRFARHWAGIRRAPRGRCVSEMTATSVRRRARSSSRSRLRLGSPTLRRHRPGLSCARDSSLLRDGPRTRSSRASAAASGSGTTRPQPPTTFPRDLRTAPRTPTSTQSPRDLRPLRRRQHARLGGGEESGRERRTFFRGRVERPRCLPLAPRPLWIGKLHLAPTTFRACRQTTGRRLHRVDRETIALLTMLYDGRRVQSARAGPTASGRGSARRPC